LSMVVSIAITIILSFVSPVDAALAWGSFLGADWATGEENMRNDLSVFIKNTQRICTKDVEKLCLNGRYINAQSSAYTTWTDSSYRRHMYKHWVDVPFGFGPEPDDCLRHELEQYQTVAKKLISKCVEWMEKTEGQFDKVVKRESGNDKREAFVAFSTIFATGVSGVAGYMIGLFLKDRDDIFQFNQRAENKRILLYFGVAVSLPLFAILWVCPKLLLVMGVAYFVGRGAQYYVQRRKEQGYGLVPGSDSGAGLVFAAIPVDMN